MQDSKTFYIPSYENMTGGELCLNKVDFEAKTSEK